MLSGKVLFLSVFMIHIRFKGEFIERGQKNKVGQTARKMERVVYKRLEGHEWVKRY